MRSRRPKLDKEIEKSGGDRYWNRLLAGSLIIQCVYLFLCQLRNFIYQIIIRYSLQLQLGLRTLTIAQRKISAEEFKEMDAKVSCRFKVLLKFIRVVCS